MGKKSAPPPPDYTPIAMAAQSQQQASEAQLGLARDAFNTQSAQADRAFTAQQGQADKDYGLQQDALDWAKSAYSDDKARNDAIVGSQLQVQDESLQNARKAQARYESVYQPLEDQAVADAKGYTDPARRDQAMGAAGASAAKNAEGARLAAAQNLESFGVDPSSTRYTAMDVGVRTRGAADKVTAENNAGQQFDATGRALVQNAINVGRGLPADVNAGNNTAINAGQSGANIGLATTNSGGANMGTAVQYGGLGTGASGVGIGAIGVPNGSLNAGTGAIQAGTGAVSAWGNTINDGYNNQLNAFKASQSGSSGIGSVLGAAAGFAPMMGLAEGGAVPGDGAPEHSGAAVPVSASPSRGRAIDDVSARLTPGEFVVPKDVVQWKGEEFFQKLAEKTRKDREEKSPQKPRAMMASPQPVAFNSRALPV